MSGCKVKPFLVPLLCLLVLGGCAPKLGQDILIEPAGNLQLQNSADEVLLGVLSLLGAPVEKEPIRLGGNLKVTNRWGRDVTLVSLSYALDDGDEVIAEGEVDMDHPITVPQGEASLVPIVLRIDPERLSLKRMDAIYHARRTMTVKGEAVLEIWGFRKRYPFKREVTKPILKALKTL